MRRTRTTEPGVRIRDAGSRNGSCDSHRPRGVPARAATPESTLAIPRRLAFLLLRRLALLPGGLHGLADGLLLRRRERLAAAPLAARGRGGASGRQRGKGGLQCRDFALALGN